MIRSSLQTWRNEHCHWCGPINRTKTDEILVIVSMIRRNKDIGKSVVLDDRTLLLKEDLILRFTYLKVAFGGAFVVIFEIMLVFCICLL